MRSNLLQKNRTVQFMIYPCTEQRRNKPDQVYLRYVMLRLTQSTFDEEDYRINQSQIKDYTESITQQRKNQKSLSKSSCENMWNPSLYSQNYKSFSIVK